MNCEDAANRSGRVGSDPRLSVREHTGTNMVDDAQVNPTLMSYAYRALHEITDETFGDDSTMRRRWYAAHGTETLEVSHIRLRTVNLVFDYG